MKNYICLQKNYLKYQHFYHTCHINSKNAFQRHETLIEQEIVFLLFNVQRYDLWYHLPKNQNIDILKLHSGAAHKK